MQPSFCINTVTIPDSTPHPKEKGKGDPFRKSGTYVLSNHLLLCDSLILIINI